MCDLRCDRHRHFSSVIYHQHPARLGAAEAAADRKSLKYAQLALTYIFVRIALETFGPLNMAGFQFLNKLERRI